jgi:hypothetical protein
MNKPSKKYLPLHQQYPDIKYIHLRYNDPDNEEFTTDPHGGATLAYRFITDKETNLVNLEFGLSLCSYQDVYCRSSGRRIAIHRLLSKAPHWYYSKELSSKEAVIVGYEELIILAADKWKKELATWADTMDDFDEEFEGSYEYQKESALNKQTIYHPV